VLVASVATVLFVPKGYLSEHIGQTALAALFGFSNVVLSVNADSYFAPRAEFNPFTHTWSLGVEEQFYIVFPLLHFALVLHARRFRVAPAVLALLCVASFVFGLIGFPGNASARYYMVFGRFWELGIGIALYRLLARHGRIDGASGPGAESRRTTYIGTALIAAGFIVGDASTFPVPGAVLPAAGTVLIVVALHSCRPTSLIARTLTMPAIVAIGRLSYSLYLWHWPVFVLFRWTVGFETFGQKAMALGAAIVLSLSSYYGVERPFRYSPMLRRSATALGAVLGLLLACALATRFLYDHQDSLSLSRVMAQRGEWYPDRDFALQRADGCRIERETRALAIGTAVTTRRLGCASPDADTTIHVIGDSHAGAYFPLLGAYALATGTTIVTYSNAGCAFLNFSPDSPPAHCGDATRAALDDIRRTAKRGDVIFMPSLRLFRLREQWDVRDRDAVTRFHSPIARDHRRRAVDEAVGVLQEFADRGITLLFELPKPIFRTPLFLCSDWFNRANPVCSGGTTIDRDFLEAYRAPIVAVAREMESRLPGFHSWDPFPVLCPGNPCTMKRGESPLFLDSDHISAYGNRVLLEDFSSTIERARKARQP
jgi:peptidoglycan/LPS O-acetylase OafA/YrhL